MSTVIHHHPVTVPARSATRSIWAAAGVSGALAAIGTTSIAAVARAADISLEVDGEAIPLLGFAQMTLVGALIGAVLAVVLHKRARTPRRTFVATTVVLTALSIVPDLMIGAAASTKVTLILTHLVAAAIVVPALAARVRGVRQLQAK